MLQEQTECKHCEEEDKNIASSHTATITTAVIKIQTKHPSHQRFKRICVHNFPA